MNLDEERRLALEELYKIIQMNFGLHLLSSPPGSGKTHDITEAIMNYAYNTPLPQGQRIIFLAPQKKNLNSFSQYENYEKFVLRIKSREDCFEDFFEQNNYNTNVIKKLPFLKDNEDNMLIEIERYSNLKKDYQNKKSNNELTESYSNYINNQKNNILDKFYKKLHNYMKKFFNEAMDIYFANYEQNLFSNEEDEKQNENVLTSLSPNEMYDFYKEIFQRKEINEFQWLKTLSPEYYLPIYRIGVMTQSKFLYPIHYGIETINFYKTTNNLIGSPNFTLVIDEFDKYKEIIRDFLIKIAIEHPNDLRGIMNKLMRKPKFSEIMKKTISHHKKTDNKINNDLDALNEVYHFDLGCQINVLEKENFLGIFDSHQFTSLYLNGYKTQNANDKKTEVMLKFDKEKNLIVRDFAINSNDSDSFSLKSMVRKSMALIVRKKYHSFTIGNSYSKEKEKVKFYNENYLLASLEDNIKSYLQFYGFDISEKENFVKIISSPAFLREINKKQHIAHPLAHGFNSIFVENGYDHQEHSYLKYYDMQLNPEIIMGNICQKFNVIAISATGTMISLNNFAFDYFKMLLGDKLFLKHQFIDNYYRKIYDMMQQDYDNNGITIIADYVNEPPKGDIIRDGNSCNFKEFDLQSKIPISSNVKKELASIIKDASSDFEAERFFQIVLAIISFLSDSNHHWGLFFTYYGYNTETGKKRKEKLEEIIKILCEEFKIKSYKPIFYSNEYKNFSTDIQKYYKSKEKVLIFSAYASLGTSANLQGEITEKESAISILEELKNEKNMKRYKTKDVDFMFLSSIHYQGICSSDPDLNTLDEKNKFQKILCSLSKIDELKKRSGADLPISKFQKFISGIVNNIKDETIPNKETCMIANNYLGVVLQAVGRINRCFLKNKKITILLDNDFKKYNIFYNNNAIMTPEFRKIINLLQKNQDAISSPYNLQEETRNKTFNLNQYMNKLLKKINKNEASIEQEKTCKEYNFFRRDALLCYPTLDNLTSINITKDISSEIYNAWIAHTWKDSKYNYTFSKINGSKKFDTGFDANYLFINEEGSGYEVSAKKAGLDIFMQNPLIYEGFKSNGFATEWKKGKYILNPYAFHIYKGILGEEVARIFFREFGLPFAELDIKFKELFDFCLRDYPNVMIDIKHWSYATSGESINDMREEIIKKMEKINIEKNNCDKVFIVKIFAPSDKTNNLITFIGENENQKIYSVTGICDKNGFPIPQVFSDIIELVKA